MKSILALVFCLPLAGGAAELNGVWKGQRARPGGLPQDTYFVLKTQGGRVTGKIVTPNVDFEIIDGKLEGDRVSLPGVSNWGGQERKQMYRGKVDGDRLVFPQNQKGATGDMVAVKISGAEAAKVTAPYKKVPLPKLRDLPPNGLARTPPMGWNSWNHFRIHISDKDVREIADAMVKSGMAKAGYVYINIDDGWQGERDAKGVLQPNSKFPNMKALTDYVHSKGLKIGIYSSPGPNACAGTPGSWGYEELDARTWAAWGFDYLKYDWCGARRVYEPPEMRAAYQKMAEALRATKRPIVYSLCQYGLLNVQEWGAKAGGNLWRTTGDIRDTWESMSTIGFAQDKLAPYAGPGHWNDPDMLEIGNGGMTAEEYRVHMSLWCLLAAPLLSGDDPRIATRETLDILTNAEVIAVDQDKLGKQGTRVAGSGDTHVYAKPLADGSVAVGLFNTGTAPAKVRVAWKEIGKSGKLRVRDLWAHADRGVVADAFSADVAPHGVVMVRVR